MTYSKWHYEANEGRMTLYRAAQRLKSSEFFEDHLRSGSLRGISCGIIKEVFECDHNLIRTTLVHQKNIFMSM